MTAANSSNTGFLSKGTSFPASALVSINLITSAVLRQHQLYQSLIHYFRNNKNLLPTQTFIRNSIYPDIASEIISTSRPEFLTPSQKLLFKNILPIIPRKVSRKSRTLFKKFRLFRIIDRQTFFTERNRSLL